MRKIYMFFLMVLAGMTTVAQTVSYSSGTITQDFNTLPSSATTYTAGSNYNGPYELSTNATNASTFSPAINATGLAGWYISRVQGVGSGSNTGFVVNNGSGTTGAVYSYGTAGAADRALGSLASSTKSNRIGVLITNNSSNTYNSITITFTGETWRRVTNASQTSTLKFFYKIGSNTTTIDDASGFTANTALNYVAQGTVTGAATDGNTAGYRTTGITTTITGLSWAPNQVLALKWEDIRDATLGGSMQGIAIDDFSFSAAVAATPSISVPTSLNEIVATTLNTQSTASQSFTLNCSNVSSSVTIASNNGFQVSTSANSGFTTSLVLTSTQASANPTIFVRYTPTVYGLTTGTISITNTNSNNPNISVTGSVNNLATGNLIMLGFVTSSTPDYVTFATLVNIPGGTEIKVTDRAWDGTAFVNVSGDNVVTYTAPAGGLTAGTVVTLNVSGTGSPSATTGTLSGTMVLTSTTGDQIFLYQGTDAAPVFMSGFSTSTWINTGSTTSATSYLPSTLTAGTTASNFTSTNGDAYFTSTSLIGSISLLQTTANNPANWTRAFVSPTPAYTVTILAPLPTTQPNLSAVSATDNSITFSFSGGDGINTLVTARLNSSSNTDPTNGSSYTGQLQFGNGSAIGASYVVYSGGSGSNTITVTDLTPGTTYTFNAYSFNGTGANNNYLTPAGTINLTTTGVAPSSASDIVENTGFSYNSNIAYASFQEATSIAQNSNSIDVASFTVRDGGASGDADALPTVLTSLTLSASNSGLIRRAALYSGSTRLAETAVSSSTISFTGFSHSTADDVTSTLTIRVSFNSSSIVDKTQFGFTITGTSTSGSGSGMANPNGGGAVSSTAGNINKVDVVANRLNFTTQPSSTGTSNVVLVTQPVVTGQDQFNNTDLDFSGLITLSNSGSLAMTNNTATATNGVATFSGLRINAAGVVTLSATNGTITSLTASNSITLIQGVGAGDLVFVAYQTSTPDRFALVAINDIPANTVLNFTDNGYNGTSNTLATNEGTFTWTGPASVITKGTVISFQTETTPSVSIGTLGTIPAGFALGTGGDQILVYQGSASSPTFIAALSTNSFISTGTTSTSTTYVPQGLTSGVSAMDFSSNSANGFYTGPTTLSDDHKLSFLLAGGAWTRSSSVQSWTGASWNFNFGTNSFVNAATSIGNVTLNTGNSITVNALTTLTVTGTITNNGGTLTNNGTVTFSGASAAITGNNLTIDNLVTVASGGTLTTNNKLVLGPNAQLLHGTGTTGGTGTIVGNITMQRTGGTTQKKEYNMWSAPVTGATLRGVGGSDFYSFNATTQSWTFLGFLFPTPSTMTVGRGYMIAGAQFTGAGNYTNGISSFTGTPNTGNISVSVTDGPGASDGWNFIGNPYPTNLNTATFIAANTNLNGSLYVWDKALNDYRTIASGATTYIAAAQGFFVDATASGNANFTNAMRSSSATTFYRQGGASNLVLKAANDSAINTLTIGFDADATDAFDRLYDARKLKGNPFLAFYSQLNGLDLATQSFAPLTANKVVALGVDAQISGNHSISLDQIQGIDPSMGIFLQDVQTGAMHNLRTAPYTFTVSQTGSLTNRFFLHLQALTTGVSNPAVANASISAFEKTILVQTGNDQVSVNSLRVLDLSGRVVESILNINESGSVRKTLSVSEGAYLVQATLSNGQVITSKVMIP